MDFSLVVVYTVQLSHMHKVLRETTRHNFAFGASAAVNAKYKHIGH
jgi:hypothetical protein